MVFTQAVASMEFQSWQAGDNSTYVDRVVRCREQHVFQSIWESFLHQHGLPSPCVCDGPRWLLGCGCCSVVSMVLLRRLVAA